MQVKEVDTVCSDAKQVQRINKKHKNSCRSQKDKENQNQRNKEYQSQVDINHLCQPKPSCQPDDCQTQQHNEHDFISCLHELRAELERVNTRNKEIELAKTLDNGRIHADNDKEHAENGIVHNVTLENEIELLKKDLEHVDTFDEEIVAITSAYDSCQDVEVNYKQANVCLPSIRQNSCDVIAKSAFKQFLCYRQSPHNDNKRLAKQHDMILSAKLSSSSTIGQSAALPLHRPYLNFEKMQVTNDGYLMKS